MHLGNYYGAVRNFLRMQKDYECFFFIADFHSLTTHPTPKDQHENVKSVLSEYLAAGLDPELCTLYIQSDIPEIPELSLLLNMISYVGELERTTTFKEKVRKQPDNVNAGLLTYPVLMAADILIHRSHKVPVGKDQQPHLEFTRKLAQRFNSMYQTEFFPLPEPFNFGKDLVKVPGLDGSGKMGKSEGNGVYLVDSADEVRKKVMRAVTDSGPTQANQEMPEPIRNLFYLMEIVSDAQTLSFYKEKYANCEIRYGDMKKQLAEDIIKITSPIRERILEIMKDNDYLKKVARIGAEKARASASKTLAEVRKIIGFKSF